MSRTMRWRPRSIATARTLLEMCGSSFIGGVSLLSGQGCAERERVLVARISGEHRVDDRKGAGLVAAVREDRCQLQLEHRDREQSDPRAVDRFGLRVVLQLRVSRRGSE